MWSFDILMKQINGRRELCATRLNCYFGRYLLIWLHFYTGLLISAPSFTSEASLKLIWSSNTYASVYVSIVLKKNCKPIYSKSVAVHDDVCFLRQVSAGLLKLWGAVGAVCTETPSETTISPNLRWLIWNIPGSFLKVFSIVTAPHTLSALFCLLSIDDIHFGKNLNMWFLNLILRCSPVS